MSVAHVDTALPRTAKLMLPMSRTALIIIDMQHDFVTEGGFGAALGNDVATLRVCVPALRRMLASARKHGLPVVHTVEGHDAGLVDCPTSKLSGPRAPPEGIRIGDQATYGEGMRGRILVEGEPGCTIVDDLLPQKGELLLRKPGKGSFYNTSLHDWLQHRGVTHLIVGGVTTEVCVQTTCREANDRGYEVVLMEDGSASYFPEFHASVCNMVVAQGGIVGWTALVDDITSAFDVTASREDSGQLHRGCEQVEDNSKRRRLDADNLDRSLNAALDDYFSKIKVAVKDSSAIDDLLNLFALDAMIDSDGQICEGQAAIRAFYSQGSLAQPNFCPYPVEGSRCLAHARDGQIQVDIFLCSDVACRLVRGVFRFAGGKFVHLQVRSLRKHVAEKQQGRA